MPTLNESTRSWPVRWLWAGRGHRSLDARRHHTQSRYLVEIGFPQPEGPTGVHNINPHNSTAMHIDQSRQCVWAGRESIYNF